MCTQPASPCGEQYFPFFLQKELEVIEVTGLTESDCWWVAGLHLASSLEGSPLSQLEDCAPGKPRDGWKPGIRAAIGVDMGSCFCPS